MIAPISEPMMPLSRMFSPSPAIRLKISPPTSDPANPAMNAIVQSTRGPSLTDDELGEGTDAHSETEDCEDQHAVKR